MREFLRKVKRKYDELMSLDRRLDVNTMLLGQLHVNRISALKSIATLREVEFKAFSQGGEDGIIQYLISHIPIENRAFIEFGVESYKEANTRYLLLNDDWRGLVIDGSRENVDQIRKDGIAFARHDLSAICSFITRENVDELFRSAGFSGDIGLLSIDIDGNDYWIWEAIQSVSPRIVICEYNSIFGAEACVTIPYDPLFERSKAHYSCLYFGASLSAICHLAANKGYDFVGSNSMGTNAFFVRKDLDHKMKPLTAKEGYVRSTHRMDSRDIHNNCTYVGGADRLSLVKDLPVLDVMTNKTVFISEFAGKE